VPALDPNIAIPQFTTLERVTADSVARPRFVASLLALFAVLALALAAIGIFGLLSFSVAQQTREIGLRIAMGAPPGDVMWRVLGRALRLAGAGLAVGLLVSLAVMRLLESMLFDVSATDPVSYVCATTVLALTVMAAAFVPAHRAAIVDPMVALRAE
jgi:putative ABC transport system permease protein